MDIGLSAPDHVFDISDNMSLLSPSPVKIIDDSYFDFIDEAEIFAKLKLTPSLEKDSNPITGQTLLHIACSRSYISLINYLMRRQVDLDSIDLICEQTPLHLCVCEKTVRLLCSHGANVAILDKNKESAMHVFVRKNLISCIMVMLSYDFDPSSHRTMNPNTLDLVEHKSCLHLAAELEDLELLNILIADSKTLAYINVRDEKGNSVLHSVIEISAGTLAHQKAIMILLDKGISPDAKNSHGATPLHLLCANRSFSDAEMIEPLIELLLNMNCDPNSRDDSGCTPLIIACAHREWAVCKVLLLFGADMNAPCRLDSKLLLRSQNSISSPPRVVAASSLSADLASFSAERSRKSFSCESGGGDNSIPSPTYIPFSEIVDCTASDLFPKRARCEMFGAISSTQTWVPDDNRDR